MIELRRGPGASRVDTHVEVVRLTAPWDQPVDLAPYVVDGRRRLILSACGEVEGVWLDGPLAHVAAGKVASYVPAGGPATLQLPAQPAGGLVSLAVALATEGTPAERAHRCLLARLVARLPSGGPLRIELPDYDVREAVTLALIRQARPADTIVVAPAAPLGPPPAAWRRFCENARLLLAPLARYALPEARVLDYRTVREAIPSRYVAVLAAELNRYSDLLPKSLVTG